MDRPDSAKRFVRLRSREKGRCCPPRGAGPRCRAQVRVQGGGAVGGLPLGMRLANSTRREGRGNQREAGSGRREPQRSAGAAGARWVLVIRKCYGRREGGCLVDVLVLIVLLQKRVLVGAGDAALLTPEKPPGGKNSQLQTPIVSWKPQSGRQAANPPRLCHGSRKVLPA